MSTWTLVRSNMLQLKLMLLVVACGLIGLHVASPNARAFSYGSLVASIAVAWRGARTVVELRLCATALMMSSPAG